LLTRHVTIKDSPEQSQFLPIGGVVLMLLPFLIHKWVMPPDLLTWTLLITCGVLGGIGHISLAHAHRYAPSSTLGPFLYQKIIYMILWGWVFFNQLPDLTATIGTIIVALSGLYLARHEMKLKNVVKLN
jgi:drug/metabolite transporter (DMT)-like permease